MHPMYRIASNNSWHNGRAFDSLAEAKRYADKHGTPASPCDVIAYGDRSTWRAVYSGNNRPINRGTYRK